MKRLFYFLALIILSLGGYYLYTYWALGNDSDAQPGVNEQEINQPIVGENLEGEADPSRMTLSMTTWRWQNSLYNDGVEFRPGQLGTFTLKFNNDGSFSLTTDCNSAGGKYVVNGSNISFTDIYSTKMYCEGSKETEFIQLLTNTSDYHFTSRGELVLNLKFDSGYSVFR